VRAGARFNFPTPPNCDQLSHATRDTIAETGAVVWRTDQHGTITVTFAGSGRMATGER
jgi:beta-lactamase superfamily II metal-dependent hydrolase